jgi:hypothetical protein
MQRASNVFGAERANGIFTELVKRFGPYIAKILLELLLSKQQGGSSSSPIPEAGSAPTIIGVWIASILEDNREEILELICTQVGILFDEGVAALRGV